jgi:hypothetical protein
MDSWSRTVSPTPLSNAFFSDFNREAIHNLITKSVKDKTGYGVERQNDADVQALMRKVFVNFMADPYTDIRGQVERMNTQVAKEAAVTISTGMLQQIVYLRDISANPIPMVLPTSTSTYGNKLPYNTKVTL